MNLVVHKETVAQFQLDTEWFQTRPDVIKELFMEFPPGTHFITDEEVMWIISYNENDTLGVSSINPTEDYQGAIEKREFIHASHLRLDSIGE